MSSVRKQYSGASEARGQKQQSHLESEHSFIQTHFLFWILKKYHKSGNVAKQQLDRRWKLSASIGFINKKLNSLLKLDRAEIQSAVRSH